ncbi:MAG: Small MutS-related domain-containing protein [Candidatus Tokpelaia hoelldobleri]|uniref:Small MutS-related domain-containing protein n=1 Tax=Candidatus Tokpelaia hoelldobleri TaxID=1902579 RepID=A0A1U9JWP3_9HYPH|nr:MAG: Small MutS-related domain-containing protein [Candidatus Tokpelaia hoelldoblerii]
MKLDLQSRILWEKVVHDVRPLHQRARGGNKTARLAEEECAPPSRNTAVPAPVGPVAKPAVKTQPPVQHLDRPTRHRIARGRLALDARLDLHGLTQHEAYNLLLHFVQSAQARGLRHVLVITGKGASSGSDGVLRHAVPHWLATAPFRLYVSAMEDAARHHGGHGALYIRLRRIRP